MTVVIGVCGPAGSGKTTVTRYLAHKYGARIYALATPLKEIVSRAFMLSPHQLYGTQADKEAVDERYNVSPRWLMQRIGTEGVRSVLGEDFWTNWTLNQIERDQPALAVIEDVRFFSEARYIREWCDPEESWSGTHGHLAIPNYIWKLSTPWLQTTADPTHQSESEIAQIQADHFLSPVEKTLANLYLAVDIACARFGITPTLHSIEAP